MGQSFHETALYEPIRDYFIGLGYAVYAEVKQCDIALTKDGRLTLIELKKSFTLQLLYQAIDRQKMGDAVYVAVPRPKRSTGKAYRDMLAIARRLNLGVLTVALDSPVKTVSILLEPDCAGDAKKPRRAKKKKDGLLREIAGRTQELNRGGSVGKKLMTAYREKAIRIACALSVHGAQKAAVLVQEFGCDKNAYRILTGNAYGWFVKTAEADFTLTPAGRQALLESAFAPLVAHYLALVRAIRHEV